METTERDLNRTLQRVGVAILAFELTWMIVYLFNSGSRLIASGFEYSTLVAGPACIVIAIVTLERKGNRAYALGILLGGILTITAVFWLAFIGFALSNHP